jgi:hypothetical protein
MNNNLARSESSFESNAGVQAAVDCHKCEHYYVTWDKAFPHGCKRIGFKSKRHPCIDVRVNSCRPCLLMERKAGRNKEIPL